MLRVVLPFLCGYYFSYVFRSVNAVLGPGLAAEFGLSAAQLGLLTGVYFLSFGLVQIPLGVVLDRFGPRRTNGTLLVLAALGGFAFANAHSFEALVLSRALIGLGVSVCLMASIQAFVLWFPAERTATMIALAYSMGGLGALTASAPLEFALRYYDWRQIFDAVAAATLALAVVFAFVVPEHPGPRRAARVRELFAGLGEIVRDAAFWRIALCVGANQCAVLALFTLWITTWLRDVAGYDRVAAAAALGWVAVALSVGFLFFGRLADRRTRAGRANLPLLAAGMAGSSICLALLTLGVTTGAALLWAACIFLGTGSTLAHSIVTRRFPREMAGRINTMLNTFTFMGAFLGQWGCGAILGMWPPTATGYEPAAYFYAFGSLWIVQAAGLVWLWSGRRHFAAPAGQPLAQRR